MIARSSLDLLSEIYDWSCDMKIGDLDMHCGNCGAIDYCTQPYKTPALCCVSALADISEENYIQLAEEITSEEIEEKQRQNEENGVG